MNLARIFAEQLCPACGYKLDFQPWSGDDSEHHCPCCGIHFGIDDKDEVAARSGLFELAESLAQYRAAWWSKEPEPADYDPTSQMARLERFAAE